MENIASDEKARQSKKHIDTEESAFEMWDPKVKEQNAEKGNGADTVKMGEVRYTRVCWTRIVRDCPSHRDEELLDLRDCLRLSSWVLGLLDGSSKHSFLL